MTSTAERTYSDEQYNRTILHDEDNPDPLHNVHWDEDNLGCCKTCGTLFDVRSTSKCGWCREWSK